ncbi:MAG TPA: asparagine synthase (glutamine-hydrolyzing) [Candidatus Binatia bacterium]|jgi:asparagine synthase (glutamine-hydrolysing)
MSGILCVYNASGVDQDLQRYLAALRRLTHRGPDGEGSDLRRNLFLGVRRFSIGRGSTGEQPLVGGDGNIIVALDGHVHNREELAHSLKAKGYYADLSSDPALILGAYTEYGERCFERLRGVWALVLWDEREHRLLLSRDPVGVKPLYYYVSARHLLVASEIKSIIALDRDAGAMDRRRIQNLVHEGRIDDWTATCFSHIKPVPPGTVLRLAGEQITTNRYWNLRPSTDRNLSPGDILERLINAVERHTPSDVKVGLALSGGIDSSSIAGVLTHPSLRGTRSVHAFSINPPKTADESFLIDATVRRTGIPHTYVSLDALDYPRSLARLIDFHDEPIQYSGVFYQFALRRQMAAAGCKAVLVGYGADEIFGGYRYLAPAFLTALAACGRLRDAARFVLGAREFFESPPLDLVRQTLRYARERARASLIQRIKRTIGYEAYRRRRDDSRPRSEVMAPLYDRGEESDPTPALAEFELRDLDRGRIFFKALLECFRTNIALLVRLEDRNAMAHGLDLCAPFMDTELIHAALAFPFHRYMEGGWNKAILRDAAEKLLAPEVSKYRRKLATPGNDAYVAFEVLRPEFLELLSSESFYDSGLWSRRCRELYTTDSAARNRGGMWFRVYMVHKWYERVVRSS